ncbi:MAG: DUF1566 domain-containing protein [Desulfoprunum sp.]|nr:DUF1566 domain-containing protein [Desulfoprunum sp.]
MQRFQEQNEVILDRQTGLMWPRNASLSDFPMTWNEALSFIKEMNHSELYGFSDWKLPNRKELFSLMSHETINPSLPRLHPFMNVFSGYYWTSTSSARLPKQAWYIHLGGARVFLGIKYSSYMVWPVRLADSVDAQIFQTGQRNCYEETGETIDCQNTGQDGQFQSGLPCAGPRFREDANLVYDNATELIWLKNANFNNAMLDWRGAVDLVEKMNSECQYGYNDWRLPNIVELESLTDMAHHSPALPVAHPFKNVQEFYWSSTTSMYETRYAWVLYMRDGAVGVGFKPLSEFYLWPVRKDIEED